MHNIYVTCGRPYFLKNKDKLGYEFDDGMTNMMMILMMMMMMMMIMMMMMMMMMGIKLLRC